MSYPNTEFFHGDTETAICEVKVQMPSGEYNFFRFSLKTGNAAFADLLTDRLCNQLTEQQKQVKRAAYELGYKHGKNRQKKREEFYGDLDDSEEGL